MQPSWSPNAVPETMVALPQVQGGMRTSLLTAVAALVDKHTEEALSVLRRWLDEPEQP